MTDPEDAISRASEVNDDLAAHEREVRAYAADSGDPILRRHLTAVLPERYTLAEAEILACHAGLLNWWSDRIMQELDTVRAQNAELRKVLGEERRERREQR